MDWRNNIKRGDRIQVQGNIGGRIKTYTVHATKTTQMGRLWVQIEEWGWVSANCVYALAEQEVSREIAA